MKRICTIAALTLSALLLMATAASAATTIRPEFAPTGTHFQSGSEATCSTNATTGVVSCSSYELAGVGNANATATLSLNYTATVQCRNHGRQIVEVKSQVTGATKSTGALQPKNGKLTVPALTSQGTAPSAGDFEAQATCPNPNWTKETLTSTIMVSGFTYTLHFEGFSGNFITITG
jgi:hypothetical protein